VSELDQHLRNKLTSAYGNHWAEFQKIFKTMEPKEKLLSDLFLLNVWTQSYRLALRQTEELFCDAIGLRLFGESFLYSFIYLIAPNLGERAPHYPTLTARVSILNSASVRFGIKGPPDFGSYFSDSSKGVSAQDAFVLRMADEASNSMINELITAIENHVAQSDLTLPSNEERDRLVKHFCALSPGLSIKSLGDIVNAGWHIRLNWSLWDKFRFEPETKYEILNDLVFKTMEVMEFESRTAVAAPNA